MGAALSDAAGLAHYRKVIERVHKAIPVLRVVMTQQR